MDVGGGAHGVALPPHARGCTRLHPPPRRRIGASPARAGMYPTSRTTGTASICFPRTRGDVPSWTDSALSEALLPPHARGCTLSPRAGPQHPRASPARAGMYLRGRGRGGSQGGFPRTRGDVPQWPILARSSLALPPHARGCTAGAHRGDRALDGFPRTRGDVPGRQPSRSIQSRLPPHARGCTAPTRNRAGGRLASPARAGMYRKAGRQQQGDAGFPRTRGDVPRTAAAAAALYRLPPHARGCTARRPHRPRTRRASPARAGMYLHGFDADRTEAGFPRTRGDVPDTDAAAPGAERLPPHARGCTCQGGGEDLVEVASPARAGMYLQQRDPQDLEDGFPRTRGDVPSERLMWVMPGSLPPHARGCTCQARFVTNTFKASPARAGMYRGVR